MKTFTVYLGLGGNEGDVLRTLKKTLTLLGEHPDFLRLKCSSFYSTSPVGVETESRFVNAVCSFETGLTPMQVFEITGEIESKQGKVSKEKNASRPIDIDILFYGTESFEKGDFRVPHSEWKNRLFVLKPLSDLTDRIGFRNLGGIDENYRIETLIERLSADSSQDISLLEENPEIRYIKY